jgi:LysM repeat protein
MNVYDEQHSQEREFWTDEPTRRIARPTVSPRPAGLRTERIASDPFVTRIGLLITAGLIVVALVWAVRVSVGTDSAAPSVEAAATMVPVTTIPATTALAAPDPLPQPTAAAATAANPAPNTTAAPVLSTAAPEARAASGATQPAAVPAVQAASAGVAAVPATAPACGKKTYKIQRGDAWILIARKVKVSTKELLAANGATARTVIYPGRTICLPASATVPAPTPATSAPKPVAVQQVAPAPKATVAQAATPPPAPPTTAAPAASTRSYSQAESVAIIREIWPDELEEKALAIAWRESNHKHTARNYCCHGLFQIYFNVHKGWLKDLGITASSHLYDPYLNARAALTLYVRAGGWGPWGG